MLVLDALALSVGILALVYGTDYTHKQTNQALMQFDTNVRNQSNS
jgi:hypothetical protein